MAKQKTQRIVRKSISSHIAWLNFDISRYWRMRCNDAAMETCEHLK